MKRAVDWIRPDIVFLILASVVGLSCIVLTPPFQVADEPFHFFRIVQIAQGGLIGERRGAESGGEIPAILGTMVDHLFDGDYYSGIVHWERNDWAKLKPYLTERADFSEQEFRDFRTRTIYAPVLYFPQTLGVGLARMLKLPPLWMVYSGRFFALAFFVVLIFFAIRLTPICPWGFAVAALLPAMIFQAASLSADSTTNALLFLCTGLLFRYVYITPTLSRLDLAALFFLGALVGLCKAVYTPVLALAFLIPPVKLGGRKKYWMVGIGVLGSALLAAALWSILIKESTVPIFTDVDAWSQLTFILRNPIHFFGMVLMRFLNALRYLYLGERVGLLHEFVGMLGWSTACVYIGQTSLAAIFWCAIAEKNRCVIVPEWHRWAATLIIGGTVMLIAAANYMIWCAPGNPALALFGRYFHPIAPMAFLLLHNQSFRVHCDEKWKWLIPIYFVGTAIATVYVIAHIY